ncbi:MAG TPA: M56 family metallopeptidase [Acidobacteriota bacterium]|nr:M56 family metallopeptidase [Acidobacteriota bacterium]
MPEFILPWQETAAAWLITYLLHSSLLLGSVWLLMRLNLLRSNELRETLWKAALTGGLLTASLQAWWGYQPVSGTYDLLRDPVGAVSHWLHLESAQQDSKASSALQARRIGGGEGIQRWEYSRSWKSGQPSVSPQHSEGLAFGFGRRSPESAEKSGGATFTFRIPRRDGAQGAGNGTGTHHVIPLNVEKAKNYTFTLRPQSSPWVRGALWAWLVIGGFLGLRVVVAKLRLRGMLVPRRPLHQGSLRGMLDELCRSAGTSYVMLSVSDSIASPLAVGREICIPKRAESELTEEQQRGMLAHELAHIVRRDAFWLFFSALLQGLFFIQPLNRLARRHICEESEYLCDDWAVRQVGEGRSLARCLAEVAVWIEASPAPLLAAAMAGRRSAIVSRVRRLVGDTPRPRQMGLWRRSAAGLVLLALVAGMAPAVNAASGVRVLFQGLEGEQPSRHLFFRMEDPSQQGLIWRRAPAQDSSSPAPKAKKRYFL